MPKPQFKTIKVDYYDDRELLCIAFQDRYGTTGKWLTVDEAEKLINDLESVITPKGKCKVCKMVMHNCLCSHNS